MSENNNLSTKLETKKSERALAEERVLEFWRENKIFEKSLGQSKGKKEYIFYEGPPTANGKPGIHHLEARAFKDVIPRYKTMRGYYVRRKGGWDTHGLPVELQVEKKLGLSSKKAIEEYGIAKFNRQCKESVWEYLEFWNKFTERIGFWVDQKNPYVTYRNDYMESVWNVIKETDKRNLLYKDYKVVPWCPRCGTALSSHELAQGYENVNDLSVYVKFKIVGKNTYVLAWTTTPWTLPGNVALAVGEKIEYVKIKKDNEYYILAKSRLSIIEGEYSLEEEMTGKDLVGLEYEPLYPYLSNTISDAEKEKLNKAFKVYPADFVTTEDGTGVVHTAVMYGHDDFNLGTEIGLPKHHMVGLDGKFLPGTDFLEGRFVRDEAVAVDVIKDLAHRGLLLKKEKYEHSYPHCWRCHTALIYYARDSWYIRMSSLRDELVKENEGINWEPAHIKEGRFGEWLREIKDWAISRERYWGTPLPVWTCEDCGKYKVLGSVEDIKINAKKSGNKYFAMRHGEAESNTREGGIIASKLDCVDHLTKKGVGQVTDALENLHNKNINLIIASPIMRVKETADIIAKGLGNIEVIIDERIKDLSVEPMEGKSWANYLDARGEENKYLFNIQGGESFKDVKKRMTATLYDLEKKYKGKNILIISHDLPLCMLKAGAMGYSEEHMTDPVLHLPSFNNAEIRELDFAPLPHDDDFELDLHKPYIDEVELVCAHSSSSGQACGGRLERTKEVMDVWLDSGAMPFAQDHFPFDFAQGKPMENQKLQYPADYISEAIDQTRGWFYTLHAVGILMGRGKSYKNVICLGHILDAKGKKMSKSIGNIVDPWEMMDKYGVDTLRLWMYGVNQPGESKNFDEKTVAEIHNKVFNLLYNVLAFYELYRDPVLEKSNERPGGENILDQWILTRLDELNNLCVEKIENYKLLEPARAFREFIDELSTWYLRRSRERLKEGDADAKKTLYFVLKNLAKMMAPFTPFASEDIWQKLKTKDDVASVHLAEWPKAVGSNKNLLEEMEQVRTIVTYGLEARQKAGIKVRQPLGKLFLKQYKFTSSENWVNYLTIILDELNVKSIDFSLDESSEQNATLDTNITPELKQEGNYRELVRAIQDMRKKMGLTPSDKISLSIETTKEGQELVKKFEEDLKKVVLAEMVKFEQNDGEEIKVDTVLFKIKIKV